MQPKTKLMAALGLIGAGLALAMFFRRPPPTAPAISSPAKPPVLRQTMRENPPPPGSAIGQASASGEPGGPVRTAQTLPAPTLLAPADRALPPELPRTYPASPPPAADWDGTRLGAPLGLGSAQSVGLAGESLLHTIADGDCLPALAERYLGATERWPEIFEANRHLLASPELLPIGLQLTIPLSRPRVAPENVPADGSPTGPASAPAALPQPRGRLVPVERFREGEAPAEPLPGDA